MTLTRQEIKMWERGYVSCRMAAAKLACHITTVHRLVYDGKIKTGSVQLIGKTKYLEIGALVASQSEQVQRAFQLNDWSDVVPAAEEIAKPTRRKAR